MSSADRDDVLAGQLIERLLIDPRFRAEFRRDPAAASMEAGLPDLAAELAGSAGSIDTLVVRESRSSLAGVVMAVAVEGIGVAEARALMHHGVTGAPRGLKLPHGSAALRNPLGHAGHGHVSGSLQRELRGLQHAGSPAHAAGGGSAASPAPSAAPTSTASPTPTDSSPSAGSPAASASAPSTASPAPASAPAAATPAPPGPAAHGASAAAVWPNQHGGGAGTAANAPVVGAGTAPATPEPASPAPEPAPPNPGAQPIDGGAVPVWPDQQGGGGGVGGAALGGAAVGAGGAPGGLAALLDSPRLSAPANVRTFLTSGGADPRMVSVLDSALANHTIGLGPVEAVSDPVHVQAVDIVSVDGQPVGPGNLGARDLVTEIAALDPSVRPSEIGTPWPIHSPGFFSDAGVGNRLHLAFEMPGTDSPLAGLGTPAASGVASPAPGQVAYPALAGGQVAYPPPAGGQAAALPGPAEAPAVGALGTSPAPEPAVPLSSVAPAPIAASTQGSGANAALAYARAMIGKLPESAGSNLGPQLDRFEAQFGYHGAPWCGIFAGHVLEAAGLKPPHSVAAVASILDLARNGDPPFLKGILPVSEARPGDLVTFGGTEHVAVVTKVDAAGVHTIAGNTSQSNVSETTYSPSSVTGVVRPDYEAGTPGSIPGVWDYSGAQPPSAAATLDAAGTAPSGTAADPPPASSGAYVNPLPAAAHIGRTDMGVDANMNPGDPIVAPGNSRVLGITPNWYRGQPYVALQLLDGPMKGHNYYLAEQITPNVSVGQIVQVGQPIAHYAASGTGIEMGWAGANWEQTLAQATSGYSEGEQTAAGGSFRDFLDGLGHDGSSPSAVPDAAVPDPDASAGPDPDAVAPVPDPDAAAPTPSAPAPFTVLESHHRGAPRHTVQFLPAVQPSPGSPLYGQAPAQAPSEPPSLPAVSDNPAASTVAQPPAVEPILDQAPAAMSGGSISVSSSLLTPGQAKFAGRLAELTGLDPHVVAAWELAEESGSAAQGREAASNFNWLNIGYFDSGAGRIAFDKTFGDPVSAAEQTAKFLKGEWGGASSSIRAILNLVGHSPDEQMSAIANSDWASSHYGGGANLHGTYNELGDIQIEKSGTA